MKEEPCSQLDEDALNFPKGLQLLPIHISSTHRTARTEEAILQWPLVESFHPQTRCYVPGKGHIHHKEFKSANEEDRR